MQLSYVLPLRATAAAGEEFFTYLEWLSSRVHVVVVDGSPRAVFDRHAQRCASTIVHIPVDPDLSDFQNGKVAGVLSGMRRARTDAVVIADDDVRYDDAGLQAVAAALTRADVVRPQNYFDPLPWHAYLDTARTLLNRVTGGDWPGTLGVRRDILLRAGGYDGDVLFENLELIRTIVAAGGTEVCPLGLYVARRPPTTSHFWSQRVRQAYDELARPVRLVVWLAIGPVAITLASVGHWTSVAAGAVAAMALAESGRRAAGGQRVFPFRAAIAAPLWIAERAVCSWLALASYLLWGGVRYRGRVISRAATPLRELEDRLRMSGASRVPICPAPRVLQGESIRDPLPASPRR